ncbi:uncharacterized protein LOC117117746 isoform X2 [Anneissia japonica]|uniref:uncharacterized protein LOC117117746 isoform X2 n=1 Tax=Anneissia japonica TaxID=1529436 RepID=UPI001425B612|nr:uncharacterized protein LOC117117746 isoform X2 [Anneissia japonica]
MRRGHPFHACVALYYWEPRPKMAEAANNVIPENIKKLVRAVLLSKIGGVPIKRFPADYRSLIGENFPLRSLGFSSFLLCMKSMPDVVRIDGEKSDTCLLFGIGDETSFMSGPAIMAQFPVEGGHKRQRGRKQGGASKKENGKVSTSDLMSPLSAKFPNLVPNMKGWYSVVVKGIHDSNTANEVYRLFSYDAMVVDYSHHNHFYFFRFGNITDAERILSKYDGYILCGTRIGVSPAQEKGASSNNDASNPNSSDNNFKSQTENLGQTNSKTDKKIDNSQPESKGKPTKKTIGKSNERGVNIENKKKTSRGKNSMDSKTLNSQLKKKAFTEKLNGYESNNTELHIQLQSIDDSCVPQLTYYGIHLENIDKSTSMNELLELFSNFTPLWSHLGKKVPRRKTVHADLSFRTWEEIRAISEQFQNTHYKGEQICVQLSFKTANELGLISKAVGMDNNNSESATMTDKECKGDSELADQLTTAESTSSQYSPNEYSSSQYTPNDETNHQTSSKQDELNMESILKSLPEPVNHEVLHASDSEGSTTSTRRRRPCILDFIED